MPKPKKQAKKKQKAPEEDEDIELDLEKLVEAGRSASSRANQEDDFNVNALEFHQLMKGIDDASDSPRVLERVTGSQAGPTFVPMGQRREETFDNSAKSDGVNYIPSAGGAGETKYFSEAGIETGPERIDVSKTGRSEFRQEINAESRFFNQASELRQMGFTSNDSSHFERPDRFDESQAGRRDSFETKYEKYKPKMPKG